MRVDETCSEAKGETMAKAEMIGQLAAIARLSDDELIRRTQRLAQTERQAVAELVAHLGEVDAR